MKTMIFVFKIMNFSDKSGPGDPVAICNEIDEFCIKFDEFCINVDKICIKVDEFCIESDEFCMNIDDFVLKMMISIQQSRNQRTSARRCFQNDLNIIERNWPYRGQEHEIFEGGCRVSFLLKNLYFLLKKHHFLLKIFI